MTTTETDNGNYYYMVGYAEVDSGNDYYVKIVTPSDKEIHLAWEIGSTGVLTTELYEGASGGMAGGSSVTPLNNNRNCGSTSGLTITSGVAKPTNTGTTIDSVKWGSRRFGGSQKKEEEIILKKNTTYCRKFSSGTNGNIITFKAYWHELVV